METLGPFKGIYRVMYGIMEKKMETTIMGYIVKSKRTDSVCEAKLSNYPQPVARTQPCT